MGEFQQKLSRLRKMPLKLAFKKVITKTFDKFYHTSRKLFIKIKPIDLKDSMFEDFATEGSFLINPGEKNFYVNELKKLKVIEKIIHEADVICNHQFDLLGSGLINLGENLPWDTDFKVGFTWPYAYYKDIKIVDLRNNADVKVPWELSRFQHLFTLGKAYWITNEEKYAKEFKMQVDDWINKNPTDMSVNWTCAMDVAIRAVNWITAYFFFKDSISIEKSFWLKFNKSLYVHGQFIMRNLENKDGKTGNHYLSDIVGLLWLGIYFNSLKELKEHEFWREFSLKELEKEMFVQNNSDGSNYEASTSYHRLVTELFLLTTIISGRNNLKFSQEYMIRLEKMCGFIMNITKPNGLAPIIGDADDGRLIILSDFYSWIKNDFRHLLGIAGELFDRNDFRLYGIDYTEDILWVMKKYIVISNCNNPPLTSQAYEEGGYYILRNDSSYMCIRCGELSFRGDGVHSHNDQLSFELSVYKQDFIVDSGSYLYTSNYNERNTFRKTASHNTVKIGDFEQNEYEKFNLFFMKEQTFSVCEKFNSQNFKGYHVGYVNKCGATHTRSIDLKGNLVKIKDDITGHNNIESCFSYLTFDSDVKVTKVSRDSVVAKKNGVIMELEIINATDIEIENTFISKRYGIKVESYKLKIIFNNNCEITIKYKDAN